MSVHLTRCLALVAAPCAWPRAGCNCPTPTCRGGRHARPAFARRDVAVRTNRASLASPYAALRWADEEGNATPVAGTRALHARGRAVRVQAKEDERDEMVVAELPVAEAEVSLEAEAAQEAAAPFRAFVAGASGGVGVKLVREVRLLRCLGGLRGETLLILRKRRTAEPPNPFVGWDPSDSWGRGSEVAPRFSWTSAFELARVSRSWWPWGCRWWPWCGTRRGRPRTAACCWTTT
jgi:hypothetical protein